MLVNTEAGTEEEIKRYILDTFSRYVTEARITFGEYDIVVRIQAPSMTEVEEVVKGIRSQATVKRTVTLVYADR